MSTETVVIRYLGLQEYLPTLQAMQQFTDRRDELSADEIWLLEHPPVFTQGQNGKPEHILSKGNIPIIQTDRGGQITYHGPGQLIAYTLIDIKRKKLTVRDIVTQLENAVIHLLSQFNLHGVSNCKAPGVYIEQKKICSIGLRVRRGCTFHGLALNVAMDLMPFKQINPCGYSELEMTQLSAWYPACTIQEIIPKLVASLIINLGYNPSLIQSEIT